jgi:hypothetical protein
MAGEEIGFRQGTRSLMMVQESVRPESFSQLEKVARRKCDLVTILDETDDYLALANLLQGRNLEPITGNETALDMARVKGDPWGIQIAAINGDPTEFLTAEVQGKLRSVFEIYDSILELTEIEYNGTFHLGQCDIKIYGEFQPQLVSN